MEDSFRFADDLGPLKIVHVHEPAIGLKAVLVVDNVAKGPSIGGVRMAEDVSTEECFRLARAMTYKNAAAGLPHGGGKVVLYGDPKMPKPQKAALLRALACSLRNEEDYIFAPDMGTDEECMAWVRDEIARVVALPREIGGIPLDEIGATGWGLRHCVEIAVKHAGFDVAGARVAVQGFGAVGRNAARFLVEQGAVLVAAADSVGAIHNPGGIDVATLTEIKDRGEPVTAYGDATGMASEDIVAVECDIWIPAARPDVINESNMHRLRTKLVVEGANIPLTHGAEEYLHDKGVLCIPDFIANAGGVICAAMEYHGASQSSAMESIAEKVRRNTEQLLDTVRREQVLPRTAAVALAEQRVRRAMSFRRWSTFSTAPGWV
ncbi:MAG: glutamate dehydrogenase [Gammaproteobacteria bacterium SG8_47]|nr:MAG: glutamate dehydrogenase [Gammaproteobacteria bacterium SG8_47]